MNTSEFNASLQPGERPVGSGAGVPQSKPAPSLETIIREVKSHRPPLRPKGNAAADAAMSELIRQGIEQAKAHPEPNEPESTTPEGQPAAKPNYDIDPAMADPWDLPPDKRGVVTPEPEGFDRFRQQQYRGHQITPSDSLLANPRFEVDEVHEAANDIGIAARRDGISKEGAQAVFDMIGQDYQPPKFGTFDPVTGEQQMRAACGEKTEEVLHELRGWVSQRPAVAALLEEGVQFGNHPAVLLTIGAIAQAAKGGLDITKPSDAKVYVERVLNDPKSDYWTDGPLHKLLVQGVQYAMAVSEPKKK